MDKVLTNFKYWNNHSIFGLRSAYTAGLMLSVLVGYKLLRIVFRKPADLRGKLAIVTGASSGIGLFVANELAAKGVTVCLIARSKDKLAETVDELKSNGFDAFYVSADLSKHEDATRCHKEIMQIAGNRPVDILVNCAGAGQWKFIEETQLEQCSEMMALPYYAAFYMTRLFIKDMISRRSGYIVNVNSPVAYSPWPGCIGYACSRYAFRGFTDALRADLLGTNVRVMEIIAGETNSNYFESNGIDQSHFPYISRWIPRVTPLDVAKSAVCGITQNKTHVVTPNFLWVILRFAQLFPYITSMLLSRSPKSDKRLELLKSGTNQ